LICALLVVITITTGMPSELKSALAQTMMAALVIVLAFFFMPVNESAEMPMMRVSLACYWPAWLRVQLRNHPRQHQASFIGDVLTRHFLC